MNRAFRRFLVKLGIKTTGFLFTELASMTSTQKRSLLCIRNTFRGECQGE